MSRVMRHYDRASGTKRWDRAIPIKLKPPVEQANGTLVGDMVLANVGIQVYTHADDPSIPQGEERRELVDAATLQDEKWLASLEGLPITVEHVADANIGNIQKNRVGSILSVRFENGNNVGRYVIDTKAGFRAVKRGLRDVSVGYDLRLEPQGGQDPEHGFYDGVQRDRVANHIAMTRQGRAGNARGRYDSRRVPMDPLRIFALLMATSATRWDALVAPKEDIEIEDFVRHLDEAAKAAEDKAKDAEHGEEEDKTAADTIKALRSDLKDAATSLKRVTDERDKAQKALKSADKEGAAATKRGDSDDFRSAHTYRIRLDSLADGMEIEGADKLGNTELSKAIVKGRDDKVTADNLDDPSYVRARIDSFTTDAGKGNRWSKLGGATRSNRDAAGKDRREDSDRNDASRPGGFTADTLAAINGDN